MASWGTLGARLGRGQNASLGGFLWSLGRPLRVLLAAFLGPPGASWGPLRSLLTVWGEGDIFGGRARNFSSGSPSWATLEAILEAVLGASWVVLERRKAEKARMPKSFQNLYKIDDLGLSGRSRGASWGPLGASWRPLGPSWGHLGRLGAIFGRLGRLVGSSAKVSGSFGALQPSRRSREKPQERPVTPKSGRDSGGPAP